MLASLLVPVKILEYFAADIVSRWFDSGVKDRKK